MGQGDPVTLLASYKSDVQSVVSQISPHIPLTSGLA